MAPLDSHDLNVAHDLGTLEGKLAAIYDNTKVLPELIKKVEKHEAQLGVIFWAGGFGLSAFFAAVVAWFKTHFTTGK